MMFVCRIGWETAVLLRWQWGLIPIGEKEALHAADYWHWAIPASPAINCLPDMKAGVRIARRIPTRLSGGLL